MSETNLAEAGGALSLDNVVQKCVEVQTQYNIQFQEIMLPNIFFQVTNQDKQSDSVANQMKTGENGTYQLKKKRVSMSALYKGK